VVMKMLLSMIVRVIVHGRPSLVLNRGNVIGREGALQLWRGGHDVVTLACHTDRRLGGVLSDVLKVERMAKREGSTTNTADITSVASGRSVESGQTLLGAVAVNVTAPAVGLMLRVRRSRQSKVQGSRGCRKLGVFRGQTNEQQKAINDIQCA
jgi:hypothetical protein